MLDVMYWTCGEVLTLGAQLGTARDLPPPDVLQRRIATLFDEMDRRGAQGGLAKRDLDDARYAIVAFIDEQLFRAPWQGRQQWMLEPLQFTYFNENTAGEGFFTRLEALERDTARAHVLEVYYLCLTLGFQGKYAIKGGDGLTPTIERLAGILGRRLPSSDLLSPHGLPKEGRRGRAAREAPVLAVSVGLVVIAVLLFFGLKLALASSTSDATTGMRAATQSGASQPATAPFGAQAK